MVLEYILKANNIDPASDLSIDQSVDFGLTAGAFSGNTEYDFTVEFEPGATSLEKEGKGYVVASLGVDSGYVPYTAYSAKKSYIEKILKSSRISLLPSRKALTTSILILPPKLPRSSPLSLRIRTSTPLPQ